MRPSTALARLTNIDSNRAKKALLDGQSQGATGSLQATQAGNQLLALSRSSFLT